VFTVVENLNAWMIAKILECGDLSPLSRRDGPTEGQVLHGRPLPQERR
jgi:hypothetical protein